MNITLEDKTIGDMRIGERFTLVPGDQAEHIKIDPPCDGPPNASYVVCLQHGQSEWRSNTEKAFTPREFVTFLDLNPGDPFIPAGHEGARIKIRPLYNQGSGMRGSPINAVWVSTGEGQHLTDQALVIPLHPRAVFKF